MLISSHTVHHITKRIGLELSHIYHTLQVSCMTSIYMLIFRCWRHAAQPQRATQAGRACGNANGGQRICDKLCAPAVTYKGPFLTVHVVLARVLACAFYRRRIRILSGRITGYRIWRPLRSALRHVCGARHNAGEAQKSGRGCGGGRWGGF